MPKPTTIVSEFTPVGIPGQTTSWSFTASGIDGFANGFVGLEYPLVPGTSQTYYGGASHHEIGTFTNGTWSVAIAVPENTTPLPPEGVTGSLFVQIVELDGVTWDGGNFGAFPITLVPPPAPEAVA